MAYLDLQPDELIAITGCRQKSKQIAWLIAQKIEFQTNAFGHPVVSRSYWAERNETPPKRPHLYSRPLKSKVSYFTRMDGKHINLGTNRTEACYKLDELLRLDKLYSIAAMCRNYIVEQRKKLAEGSREASDQKTIDDQESRLERFVIPAFGRMRATDFQPATKFKYLDNSTKSKCGEQRNEDMSVLADAFDHGMVMGLVESNPFRGYWSGPRDRGRIQLTPNCDVMSR